jgi:hypothetical protein
MTKKWTVLNDVAKGSRPEAIFRGGPPASVEPGGRDDFTRLGFPRWHHGCIAFVWGL